MDFLLIIPIIISIGPVLIITIMNNNMNVKLWISFILGMVGWYLALMLRTPLLIAINYLDTTEKILLSAVLAGLFEESTRYFMLRYVIRDNKDPKAPISLGLGWGFNEALIIYVINVFVASSIYGYQWIDFLPGALERNTACMFHTAMAMLLGFCIIKNKKIFSYLILAIALHGTLNIIPFLIIQYTNNAWLLEIILFIIVIAITSPIFHVYKSLFNDVKSIHSSNEMIINQ